MQASSESGLAVACQDISRKPGPLLPIYLPSEANKGLYHVALAPAARLLLSIFSMPFAGPMCCPKASQAAQMTRLAIAEAT